MNIRDHWAECQAKALVKAQEYRHKRRRAKRFGVGDWLCLEHLFWLDVALAMAHMKRAASLPDALQGATVRDAFYARANMKQEQLW